MPAGKRTELAGQRFGRLVVVSYNGSHRHGASWLCQCDCGGVKVVAARRLVEGSCRSCGCLQREANAKKWENPESLAKVRAAMHRLWQPGGAKRVAHEAKFGPAKPKRDRRPKPKKNEAADALAAAFGLTRRT